VESLDILINNACSNAWGMYINGSLRKLIAASN